MGIKYFFKWLKTNHSESIKCIDRHDNSQCIDVLLIDMNGIIHNSAQEVYGYGSFSFPKENACDKKVYSLVIHFYIKLYPNNIPIKTCIWLLLC